jgi:hypothetical protein
MLHYNIVRLVVNLNMTSTCNPIFFYDNPTPGLSQIIEKLVPYMYNNKTVEISLPKTEIVESQEQIVTPIVKVESKVSDVITPNHPDSLFWCIYIIANGYSDYIQISRNYGVKKLEVNTKIMQYLQKNMNKMYETNIKVTKIASQVILSELLSFQSTTNLNCMLAMCIYYNINIWLLNVNKTGLLKFMSSKENDHPTYIVYKGDNGIYSVGIEPITAERMSEQETEVICLDSSTRPLKAISNYSVEQLVVLANRLKIYDTNKKYKKAELYKEISELLMWV